MTILEQMLEGTNPSPSWAMYARTATAWLRAGTL